jgi:hypothetical protein
VPRLGGEPDSARGRTGHLTTGAAAMADLVFVILTVAFFAAMALVLKGVERL